MGTPSSLVGTWQGRRQVTWAKCSLQSAPRRTALLGRNSICADDQGGKPTFLTASLPQSTRPLAATAREETQGETTAKGFRDSAPESPSAGDLGDFGAMPQRPTGELAAPCSTALLFLRTPLLEKQLPHAGNADQRQRGLQVSTAGPSASERRCSLLSENEDDGGSRDTAVAHGSCWSCRPRPFPPRHSPTRHLAPAEA